VASQTHPPAWQLLPIADYALPADGEVAAADRHRMIIMV
jgi:hypothetical protein